MDQPIYPNNIKFSIITITLNSEKYLKETIDSVLAQKFSSYEHIIWDGGSQDRTLEILKEYRHLKVHVGKDSGISDAMNQGAFLAQGRYLLHLHSDDCFAHSTVLAEADLFTRQHPDIKWFYGLTQSIDAEGKVIEKPQFVNFRIKKLQKYNIISHPSTFISKDLFIAEKGFKHNLRYCMDYDLWIRLANKHIPYAVPVIWSCFRNHSGSTSTALPLKVAHEAYLVRNSHYKGIWQRIISYKTKRKRIKKIMQQGYSCF